MKTYFFSLSRSLAAGLAFLGFSAFSQTSSNLSIDLYAGLTLTNEAGSACVIEYCSDLSQTNHWTVLTNLTLPSSPFLFVDTTHPAKEPRRFYRVSPPPQNPSPTNPNPDKLVLIPSGSFLMGQDPNAVQVTLTYSFFMASNLVTQGEYRQLMSASPSDNTGDDNYPVETVSWFDATNYCDKLTKSEQAAGRLQDGWTYRLPTEAEWEYACRAGTTGLFSFGDDQASERLRDYAWFKDNSFSTHRVGTRLPNPWGLYDMHGNVHEWCLDPFSQTLTGGTNPTGPAFGPGHVWRGGAFDSEYIGCSSVSRSYGTSAQNDIGFRVVAAPIQP